MPEEVKPDGPSPTPPDQTPSAAGSPPSAASEPSQAEKEPHVPEPPSRGQVAAQPTPSAEQAVKPAAPPAKPTPPKPPAAAAKPPAVMVVTPWESDLTGALKERFGDEIQEFSSYVGQNFLVARPEAVISILEFLKVDLDFDYLVDLTAVHWPKRDKQFDLIYVLYSFARNQRIRVKTLISEGFRPTTAVGVHLTADWLEREVFDMFGIEFEGHPNMKRILMPDEWQGFPLRKDVSILAQDTRWVQENLNIESGQ